MSVILTQKDWLLISAFLDGRLTDAEKTSFEPRLNSDADFKIAFLELQYTRKLLKSLPQKRAPRNFTLSVEYAKKSSPRWGLNRFFGFASAASAVALTVIFAWSNLFSFSTRMAAPAPMMAAVPEAAMESASVADDETFEAPMIIYWGQPQAYGKGGGGGDAAADHTDGLGGYDGGSPEVIQENAAITVVTENPEAASMLADKPDPSTLILGLPDQGTEGETLLYDATEARSYTPRMLPTTIWMIALGAAAMVFALLAIFLRKR
ncbi:MAG: hypothetical protein CVU43_15855 [Chloroflexi bacterium HGW-Chloroflexi-5]|jgi:hypothetical protein|nr:MAG: hypothetical protein CVU43_15855 [Chloroflexi bacterium HGW-Chloroflexi-5]